jgi:hypothetical protein
MKSLMDVNLFCLAIFTKFIIVIVILAVEAQHLVLMISGRLHPDMMSLAVELLEAIVA